MTAAASPPAALPHPPRRADACRADRRRRRHGPAPKPYEYGAAGPDSFGCSGLTQCTWHAAGVSLSHSSSQQSQLGTPVGRAHLQPGDPGGVVKVSDIDVIGDHYSARRVG